MSDLSVIDYAYSHHSLFDMLIESLAGLITVGILGSIGLILCFFGHRLFALGG